jgi:hypothetical protein
LNHLSKSRHFFIAVLVTGVFIPALYGEKPTQYEYNLSYIFENRGNNSLELTQEDVTIPFFMNTSSQKVNINEISHSYKIQVIDEDDNKGVIIELNKEIFPGNRESFNASYTIISQRRDPPSFNLDHAEGHSSIPDELIKEYCISTETFPKDDIIFQEIGENFVEYNHSILLQVASLVEYIVQNTTYCNFEVPQYPSATLENHLGDCDDQSILLITICRSLGIPAYLQVGIYINPNIEEKDSSWEGHLDNLADGVGWHGWAMVYIPPWGWTPVDLTLTSAESGLELIKNAPEYSSNIIPVLDVSKQSYIGETLSTRERITNSSLYVTVNNEAHIVYNSDNQLQNYLLLGLGAVLIVIIGMMFKSIDGS